jgi:hypothetical protein
MGPYCSNPVDDLRKKERKKGRKCSDYAHEMNIL